MTKLLSVDKSPLKNKKWRATFQNGSTTFHTDFGFPGMEDYTQHHDPERRERYRERHLKDLKTEDPTRAGFLSMYVLWGPYTNLNDNVVYYKNKFNL